MCSWCGKKEESVKLMRCTLCKNILYCSRDCQKASWPERNLVCDKMKKERKDYKKDRKVGTNMNTDMKNQNQEGISEASGIGSFSFHKTPFCKDGKLCTLMNVGYSGELRNDEEPGQFFATDESKNNIRNLLGREAFSKFCKKMAQETIRPRGSFKRSEFFTDIGELYPVDRFLLSCGPVPDLERVKSTLPHVLAQIGICGLMPDGSVPNIGDITVRGYNLNALEWASRRGNHEIAEWLSTDSRTKVMLTRTDSAPVAWACYTGNVELARMLVKHGANSHATTDVVFGKKPPTHLAAENSKLLAVKYLVEECGHDIRERDCSGSNIRTCIRKNFSEWRDLPGSVAVDEYAKSKGVRAYS